MKHLQGNSIAMPEPSKTQPGNNIANIQRPTLNNILPKITNRGYMTIIDVSSRYQNIKLDGKLLYLTRYVNLAGMGSQNYPLE